MRAQHSQIGGLERTLCVCNVGCSRFHGDVDFGWGFRDTIRRELLVDDVTCCRNVRWCRCFRWSVAPESGDDVYDVFHARSGVTESIFRGTVRDNTTGGSVTGTGHPRYRGGHHDSGTLKYEMAMQPLDLTVHNNDNEH